MTSNKDLFAARKADFAWCEKIISENSKSFYAAFSALSSPKRESVYAIYAFCRLADDSVDIHRSKKRLDALRMQLDAFSAGNVPDTALWRALEAVQKQYNPPLQPYYDMLTGQELDLHFRQPQTLGELEDYCYFVAGSVGLMLLPILCTNGEKREELKQAALSLGAAMQLTNILRDVGEDLGHRRVYLPAEIMAQRNYSEARLREHAVNGAFVGVWERVAKRAEELYQPMENQIDLLDMDSRLPTLTALYLYRDILAEVRKNHYACFDKKAFVPTAEKQRLTEAAAQTLGMEAEHTA